ncbi:hypothetical protein HNY73_011725 [Argiope bruennichi]|uniref:Uncharacterized protein n=1 Tax=Argiope bruennichi TaxID=94029 RepID=A0A8T0EYV9_ARGBR|nr:hypothetical protein HNY73_011725 [Argiope bruennichi]
MNGKGRRRLVHTRSDIPRGPHEASGGGASYLQSVGPWALSSLDPPPPSSAVGTTAFRQKGQKTARGADYSPYLHIRTRKRAPTSSAAPELAEPTQAGKSGVCPWAL